MASETSEVTVQGLVHGLHMRNVYTSKDDPPKEVWTFRVQYKDKQNEVVLKPVQIDAAKGIEGFLRDGDEVKVIGKERHGTLFAVQVFNVTTNSWVGAKGKINPPVISVAEAPAVINVTVQKAVTTTNAIRNTITSNSKTKTRKWASQARSLATWIAVLGAGVLIWKLVAYDLPVSVVEFDLSDCTIQLDENHSIYPTFYQTYLEWSRWADSLRPESWKIGYGQLGGIASGTTYAATKRADYWYVSTNRKNAQIFFLITSPSGESIGWLLFSTPPRDPSPLVGWGIYERSQNIDATLAPGCWDESKSTTYWLPGIWRR